MWCIYYLYKLVHIVQTDIKYVLFFISVRIRLQTAYLVFFFWIESVLKYNCTLKKFEIVRKCGKKIEVLKSYT